MTLIRYIRIFVLLLKWLIVRFEAWLIDPISDRTRSIVMNIRLIFFVLDWLQSSVKIKLLFNRIMTDRKRAPKRPKINAGIDHV